MVYYGVNGHSDYLAHHGIKGQKWGVRRYQNEDGSWTAAGKAHRGLKGTVSKVASKIRGDGLTDEQKARRKKIAKGVAIGAATAAAGYAAYKNKDVIKGIVDAHKNYPNLSLKEQMDAYKAEKKQKINLNAVKEVYLAGGNFAKENIVTKQLKENSATLKDLRSKQRTAKKQAGQWTMEDEMSSWSEAKKKKDWKTAQATATKINSGAKGYQKSLNGKSSGFSKAFKVVTGMDSNNVTIPALLALTGAGGGSYAALKKKLKEEKKKRKK